MTHVTIPRLLAIGLAVTICAQLPALASEAPKPSRVDAAHGPTSKRAQVFEDLPLRFEANRGQVDEMVRFLARGPGYSLFLTSGAATFRLRGQSPANSPEDPRADLDRKDAVLRLSFPNAKPDPTVIGLDVLPGASNYFIGADPAGWHQNVRGFAKVAMRDLYPGVSLVFYGNQGQLEYDLIVAPGADPNSIRLRLEGAEQMRIDADGNLVLTIDGEEVIQRLPKVYQNGIVATGPGDAGETRQEIASGYVLRDDGDVGFEIADYDESRTLVIDPVVIYATYLGGSGDDAPEYIQVDSSGNAYITGRTDSLDFPTTVGAFQSVRPGGPDDVFVTKLDTTGSTLVYSTFIGGSGSDRPTPSNAIALDGLGNVYVTGTTTSSDFPTANPTQASNAGGAADGFVTKLNATGNALIFSTYLGGSGRDDGLGIAVDGSGNAYVAGETRSTNFPTMNAFQSTFAGGFRDAFAAKFTAVGALAYATYLGGSNQEQGGSITVDSAGSAYVTGFTRSTDFPLQSPLQGTNQGGPFGDAFITKLSPSGSSLVYSTFLGGSGTDQGIVIMLGSDGSAIVTGDTQSSNFPLSAPIQGAFAGGSNDGFLSKLNPAGSALVFSTYFGGSGGESPRGLAVDASDDIYMAGSTTSLDFPLLDPAQAVFGGGGADGFVTKFDASGASLVFSTFLGGSGSEVLRGLAVDPVGNSYVAGRTPSTDFPTVAPFQVTYAGGVSDGFIAKIGEAFPIADAGPDQTVNEGDPVALDGTSSSDPQGDPLAFNWVQVAGPSVVLDDPSSATPSFTAPFVPSNATLTFELVVDDGTDISDPDTVDITVVNANNPPVSDAGDDATIKEGAVGSLNGSNSFDPESDPITFAWTQLAGPPVSLQPSATVAQPTFVATVAAGQTLVFQLQVSDGKESSTLSSFPPNPSVPDDDIVAVEIVFNSPPIADAGPDQTKDEGSTVQLNGLGSSDPDGGDALAFSWTQDGGPAVVLSDPTAPTPSFDAPPVAPGGEDLTFRLIVSDDDPVNPLSSTPDGVVISLRNINDPPRCDLAAAVPDRLWPPNHKLKLVEISGVLDPDSVYNVVTLTITGVTQDEPVNSLGDGDSSPDAVIQVGDPADSVLLRAERARGDDDDNDSGGVSRNGRVYEVSFTADDGFESCSGSVKVSVPPRRRRPAIDDGQNFDSTLDLPSPSDQDDDDDD